LSALSSLSHDNPDWVFPEFTSSAQPELEARDLAHPLLPRGARVANDLRVGPPGRFLFVTGSNMSGKSTLLRAVGVNVVLGEAGGPVCASHLRLPRVDLRTMMRVQDSLELGISYFMASLNRLRQVIASDTPHVADAPPLLYLLDEILQGTNTAERQIAVRTILRHLLARPAIGALTSHDLSLANAEDLRAAADAVHFTEAVEGAADSARLSFDYRLRPGIATSCNALKLMRLIGLTADDQPEPTPPAAP
jgi:DNA mismatch repair ATPase MutS